MHNVMQASVHEGSHGFVVDSAVDEAAEDSGRTRTEARGVPPQVSD